MVERIIEQKQGERLKVFCSKKDKRMNGYLSENKVKGRMIKCIYMKLYQEKGVEKVGGGGTDFSFMKNDIFS